MQENTYTEYYWSDAELSTEPTRMVKNPFTKKLEKVRAIIVAKTVLKKIDNITHSYSYILCDGGEVYSPNEIDPRYNKKPWKFVQFPTVAMQMYLRYVGFQTIEELAEEEKFNNGEIDKKPMKKSKGSLALKRKVERFL